MAYVENKELKWSFPRMGIVRSGHVIAVIYLVDKKKRPQLQISIFQKLWNIIQHNFTSWYCRRAWEVLTQLFWN
jgi:hypothetical protein